MAKMRAAGKRRRLKKRNIFFILSVLFLVLMIQTFWYIDKRIEPIVKDYANLTVKEIATDVIENAINNKIAKNTEFTQIFITNKDAQGRIQSITYDTQAASRIQSQATIQLQESFENLSTHTFTVPLGAALGSSILATYGPDIPITLVPEGAVEVELIPELTDKGINNVLLTIYLRIKTIVKVVIPFSSETATIDHKVIIGQEFIIGDVPTYYFNGAQMIPFQTAPGVPSD